MAESGLKPQTKSVPSGRNHTQAVLIFADALPLDLNRRGWSPAFGRLLRLPFLDSECQLDVDLHLFLSPDCAVNPDWEQQAAIHPQQQVGFGANLEAAVEKLAALGYQEIVIVGRDCPDLQEADVQTAFHQLANQRLVLGPDHRGGLYLIALKTRDRTLLKGIRWQQNTDLVQLQSRFGPEQTSLLEVKQDLDCLSDLFLLAGSSLYWRTLLRQLIALLIGRPPIPPALAGTAVELDRIRWQLPPPTRAS
jgi:glycosyltransferase A (GT-A) superfamily protein (DUF2064 family)